MAKEVKIILSNKLFYASTVALVLIVLCVGVYAYMSAIPNPGHGGDSVLISIAGTESTLQQAIDAGYLGGGSSAGFAFGDWETKNIDQVYHADRDGIVTVYKSSATDVLIGITDSNNPPTTIRTGDDGWGDREGITFPVKKGDYWKVNTVSGPTGAIAVYWLPIIPSS